MKYLSCLVLLILISCSSSEERRSLDGAATYQTSGVEQYFLPELPNWANNSPSGHCFKKNSFQYMDFSKLSKSHQLTYPQMVELQAQYNERLENYFRSSAVRFLKPVEEAGFFSNTLEQVSAGVKHLKLPPVSEVDVIWLEGYQLQGKIKEFEQMAREGKFDNRLPILFSSCLSRQDLSAWLSEGGLDQVGFYLLSAEWLTPFHPDSSPRPGLAVDLGELLGKQIKFHFLPKDTPKPTELILP